MAPTTTTDPAPPVPVIVSWSIGAVAGSAAASEYQVRVVALTVAVATWEPSDDAVIVPSPARLTATSATGVASAIAQTVASRDGSRNGHRGGFWMAPSSAGGSWPAPSPAVAAVNAAVIAAGTPGICADGSEPVPSPCHAYRWLTPGSAVIVMPSKLAVPLARAAGGAPPGLSTCGGTVSAHSPAMQYWYSSSCSASVSTKYRPSTRARYGLSAES